jgi:hypothetical protein
VDVEGSRKKERTPTEAEVRDRNIKVEILPSEINSLKIKINPKKG